MAENDIARCVAIVLSNCCCIASYKDRELIDPQCQVHDIADQLREVEQTVFERIIEKMDVIEKLVKGMIKEGIGTEDTKFIDEENV